MKVVLTILLLLTTLFCPAEEEVKNSRQVTVSAKMTKIRNNAKKERTETTGHEIEMNIRSLKGLTGKLKVVTIIFAKKLPKGQVVERKSTKTVQIKDGEVLTLTSNRTNLTHTAKHSVRVKPNQKKNKNQNRNRNNNQRNRRTPVRFKDVPASGEEANGWAVRVYLGGQLVGETASATHLKLDP